jgi:hypothetical protein
MNALEQSRFLLRRILGDYSCQQGLVDQLAEILDANQNNGDGSFDHDTWGEMYLVVREHRALGRKLEAGAHLERELAEQKSS